VDGMVRSSEIVVALSMTDKMKGRRHDDVGDARGSSYVESEWYSCLLKQQGICRQMQRQQAMNRPGGRGKEMSERSLGWKEG